MQRKKRGDGAHENIGMAAAVAAVAKVGMKRLNVEISPDMQRWLNIYAAETGQSIRQIVTHALNAQRDRTERG